MSDIESPLEEGQTSSLVRSSVTGLEQGVAALAGLFTAGPLGALGSWAAIRGVQGKWTPWFILGIPSAIAINAFYFVIFFAYTSIANKYAESTEATQQATPSAPSLPEAVAPAERSVPTSPSFYEAGTAVGGQTVRVDLSTIRHVSNRHEIEFVYYLGNERISSIANCAEGTWVTLPEFKAHIPKSVATQNMVNRVCGGIQNSGGPSASTSGAAIVFDPPSNIRSKPNGDILCSITSKGTIPIQQKEGDWHKTDYCGSTGCIHKGQVRF
ncbi:MAG: hypothetical protein NTZ53_00715 [Cyanobacteria bacterium]|nr:hypothetical protein [Cyanobacteriota bacterium]